MHFGAALGGLAEHLHGAYFDHFARERALLHFDAAIDHDAVFKAQEVRLAVAVDLELKPLRERVHARDAHAVQAARDFVAVVVELAARMQFGEGDFGGRALGLVLVVELDGRRDAAAVVDHAHRVVHVDRDEDVARVARHGFVDRVVDDLVDEVMQTGAVGDIADVHAGSLADGFEPFKNLDV